jgi:hypothetical protein
MFWLWPKMVERGFRGEDKSGNNEPYPDPKTVT